MWSVSRGICLGVLLLLAWLDIRKRTLPGSLLLVCGAAALLYQVGARELPFYLPLGGALFGGAFLLLSRVSGEQFGYGDGAGILILGIYLGLWDVLAVVLTAFFLLALAVIPLLAVTKMSRKASLPFYPFLASAYVIFLVAKGGM